MAWLSGGSSLHLKPKNLQVREEKSSDEYEESDEEPPGEIFRVKKIVDDLKLKKGQVYKQAKPPRVNHTFDVGAMERSKFDYAFKVRWKGYGVDDDTWEPIENFNAAMGKKIRKYCKKKMISLPEGFEEWLLPLESGDEESSGSDDGTLENRSIGRTSKASSPQPSSSRPKADEKIEEERRIKRLQQDLALSPSPEMPPKNGRKEAFDPLFDSEDEEEKVEKKKKKKRETEKEGKEEKEEKEERKKKKKEKRKEKEKEKEKPSSKNLSSNEEPHQQKKKSAGQIDAEELKRKKEEAAKKAEEELARMPVADRKKLTTEWDVYTKEREEERKRNERAELERLAAANIKQLEEEEKRKKEKKRLKQEEKERERLAELEKQKEMEKEKERLAELEKQKEIEKERLRLAELEKQKEMEREKQRLAELERQNEVMPPPPEMMDDDMMMQYDDFLEPEESIVREPDRSARASTPDDCIYLSDSSPSNSPTKNEDDRMSGHTIEDREQEEKREEREEEEETKEEEEERIEVEKEKQAIVREATPEVITLDSPESPTKNVWEEELNVDIKKDQPDPDQVSRIGRRLHIINQRMVDFDVIVRAKKRERIEKWNEEENEWRKRMYEEGRWKRNSMITDVPFNIRADRKQKDVRRVRTLRRCLSTERLPHSFRLLSSLHSMDSMASEADSLASALDLRIGEKARLQLRAQKAERKTIEVEERKEEALEPDEHLKDQGRMELFISESVEMANELMPGVMSEQKIRELCTKVIGAFLSLSDSALIPIFQQINLSSCINATILRLVRIFSPVVNLAEAGCKGNCDGGEHRKCRMLLTLLMCLSEPNRMGEGEDCLLPPNALYDCIEFSAPCQIRALIRGGCTFDSYYDEEGKNAAHRMMEKYTLIKLVWLIERGLDVNSAILPQKESDLANDAYDKPWKNCKESHEKAAFLSQLHSQRLTARSVAWTRRVEGVAEFNIRPLTLVHTLNPFAYFHRLTAVTLCDNERRDFDENDAVLLAVHSATVRVGKGLRAALRKTKKAAVPEICVPYFLIDPASDDTTFEHKEKYECTRARLTIHNLDHPEASETVELTRVGSNGPTTVFKVPKREAKILISGRRFTECLLKLISPPEHSVVLAQYFIVPYKSTMGKFAMD